MTAAPGPPGSARSGAELPRRGASPPRAAAPGLRGTNFLPGGGAVWQRGAAPAPPCRGAEGGAAPERGGRARAAVRGGGGSTVSGAGRLRPPGILQHCRAALRPPPVPGTAAHPPGPEGKLGEGAGGGGGPGPVGGRYWTGSARRSGESGSGVPARLDPLAAEVGSGPGLTGVPGCGGLLEAFTGVGRGSASCRPLPKRISVCAAPVNGRSEAGGGRRSRPLRSSPLAEGPVRSSPALAVGPGEGGGAGGRRRPVRR